MLRDRLPLTFILTALRGTINHCSYVSNKGQTCATEAMWNKFTVIEYLVVCIISHGVKHTLGRPLFICCPLLNICLIRRIVLVDMLPEPAIEADRPVLSNDSLGTSKFRLIRSFLLCDIYVKKYADKKHQLQPINQRVWSPYNWKLHSKRSPSHSSK